MRRRTVAVAAIVTLGTILTACGGSDSPSASSSSTTVPTTPPTSAPVRPAQFGVGLQSHTFVDTSRVTPAEAGHPGAPTRTLPTAIFYPTTTPGSGAYGADAVADAAPALAFGPYPVIVWAHGLTGNGVGDLDEFEPWIQAGYVVVAPTFPVSSGADAATLTSLGDLHNQPTDVSFVLTQVFKMVSDDTNALHGVLDEKHVGAAGHSLGAATVLAFYDKQYADSRFKVVYENSGGSLIKQGVKFDGITAPLLAAHGTVDDTLGYASDLQIWQRVAAPKFFLTLIGQGHDAPFFPPVGDPPTTLNVLVDQVAVAFFNTYLKHDATGIGRMKQAGNSPSVATLRVDTGTG